MRSTIPRQASTALLRPRVWLCAIFFALATFLLSAGNAHTQGIDLKLPNPLLDGLPLGAPTPLFVPVAPVEKRLPDPTFPSPAGLLYTRAWAWELQQIDTIGQNSNCDRAAWERGRIRLQVLKEKARNELELHQHNIKVEKPAAWSSLARILSYIQTTDFTVFDTAALELWAWEAVSRLDYIAIEGYSYPPFDCDKAYHLKSGGAGQRPLTPSSTAALTPFTPLSTNVAYDGQTYCTFGKADPTKVALAPSDDSGNPLSAKLLASLPLMSPGGPKVPANGGNPENQPKADKPQGGNTSKPQGPTTTAPQGDGAPQGSPSAGSKPPATGANSSGPSTAPPAENPDVPTGRGGLADALGILTGENEKGGTNIPAPPAPPEGPASGKSVLDNIDELLEIFERERKSGKTAAPGGTMPLGAGLLPTDSSQAGVSSKGSGEYAPSPDASLEPTPAPGSEPQLDPNMLKPAWERNPWPTEAPKPTGPKTAAPRNESTSAPQEPLSPPAGGQKPITGTTSEPGAAAGAVLAEILAGRNSPTHGGSSGGALFGPSVSQQSHLDQPLLSEGNLPSGESILDEIDDSTEPGVPGLRQQVPPAESPAEAKNRDASGNPESAGKTQTSVTSASQENQQIEKSSSAATPVSALSPNPGAGDITIHFKATESVLQAGSHGDEVKAQIVKLIPSEIPDLPKIGGSKTEKAALDEGHDASPVTCALGKSGKCKAQMSGSQRKVYGLPDNNLANYAADLNLKQNTGGVLQGESPAGVHSGTPHAGLPTTPLVTKSTFKIGDQTFTRFSVASADPALAAGLLASLGKTLGAKFETDQCGEKQPGPPLGMEPMSYSALGRELPQAMVSLRAAALTESGAR